MNNRHARDAEVFLLLLAWFWCITESAPLHVEGKDTIPAARPPPSQRRFNSTYINSFVFSFAAQLKDRDLATLFANCFPNTLDTTVLHWSSTDTFIVTGDIPAMWLRDSTNQVWPYTRFLSYDARLQQLVRGLVLRQLRSILLDPYANAFNVNGSSAPGDPGWRHQADLRSPPMQPAIFEGKFELDSLCAVVRLLRRYFEVTNDTTVLLEEVTVSGNEPGSSLFVRAMTSIVEALTNQSMSSAEQAAGAPPWFPYRFFRADRWEHAAYPRKIPIRRTGMVRSAFRPSDDQTQLDFLVPSNLMTLVELDLLQARVLRSSQAFPRPWAAAIVNLDEHITQLIVDVREGLSGDAAVVRRKSEAPPPSGSWESHEMFVYETDGGEQFVLMDDANLPSLLSAPYYLAQGTSTNASAVGRLSKLAKATRTFILSHENPFFYCGNVGCGVGSPHTWHGFIWPLAITSRIMTSTDDQEILGQLELLKASAQGTGFMHESFDPSNVKNFTRPWFAWANVFFGEMLLHVAETRPYLVLS